MSERVSRIQLRRRSGEQAAAPSTPRPPAFDTAAAKGCDGVEPDWLHNFQTHTGFPLTATDQRAYNRWLANAAHDRGLAIALKNDLDQIPELVEYFDFAVNEQSAMSVSTPV